jgi:hypothetical protein
MNAACLALSSALSQLPGRGSQANGREKRAGLMRHFDEWGVVATLAEGWLAGVAELVHMKAHCSRSNPGPAWASGLAACPIYAAFAVPVGGVGRGLITWTGMLRLERSFILQGLSG